MTKQYGLYKRSTGKKTIYYVRFRDPDTNERFTAISTGCSRKADAENFAINYIKLGKLEIRSRLTFRNYTAGFFDYKTSPFIKNQLARGISYSPAYANNNNGLLKKHLIPFFGDMQLSKIKVLDIENLIEHLIEDEYGLTTLKNIMNVLSSILGEAYRTELIKTNPMERVTRHVPKYESRNPIPEPIIKTLFFENKCLDRYWGGNKGYFLINFMALFTGMRQSELLATRWCDVKSDHVELKFKYDRKYGLSAPKYHSERTIPLPPFLKETLAQFRLISGEAFDSEAFIFTSHTKRQPIDRKVVNRSLYCALNLIGIDEPKRQELRISFHSWRHTFTTLLRRKIDDATLQLVTGHKSEKMLDTYTKFDMSQLRHVLPAQEEIYRQLVS